MKKLLLPLLAFSIHHSAFLIAADPVVVVTSATSVTVDGVEAGKPADTIHNRPELASAIQLALEAWATAQQAATAAAIAERDAIQAKFDATTVAQAALVTTAREAMASDKTAAEKLTTLATVLADAGKTVEQREKEKLEAEIAEAEKALAEKKAKLTP